MKKKWYVLTIAIVIVCILGICYIKDSISKKQEDRVVTQISEENVTVKPTRPPDTALPTVVINGKLYRVEGIMKSEAIFEETDFVGIVESEVELSRTPSEELESNCLPIGTLIYKHQKEDDVFICLVYNEISRTYRYSCAIATD